MKHKKSKKKELLRRLRTKQRVVQFADLFQFVLHVVIILQPTLDLFFLFGPDADLFVSASRIVDRKDQGRMPFAAGACLTTLLMPNRALQEEPRTISKGWPIARARLSRWRRASFVFI